jgi:hypothetical protein
MNAGEGRAMKSPDPLDDERQGERSTLSSVGTEMAAGARRGRK